jgi:hypothetical protein
MSISKVQAAALADGFLDNLGDDNKDELQPRETFTELILLVGEMVETMQHNLVSSKSISSGNLSASILASNPRQVGTRVECDILMNFYGLFVNAGVKGLKSGSSTKGYSFRSEYPSINMLKSLKSWVGHAQRSTPTVRKYKSISGHETKQRSISETSSLFALGRSIKQKGIKPTGFLDKAVITTANKIHDRLGAALKVDILNSL